MARVLPTLPPDFDVDVDCNAGTHVVRVRRGLPRPDSHPVEERLVAALGGHPPKCEQIVRAAKQNYRQLRLAPGTFPWMPQVSGGPRQGPEFPPRIEPEDVPQVLRRLAVLRHLRADALKKEDPKAHIRFVTESFVKRLLDTIGVDTFSKDSRVKVRAGPGRPGGRFHSGNVHLNVSSEWLQSVYLFGLELLDSNVTLAATHTGDSVILHQISTQGFVESRRWLPKSEIKGIRPSG